MFIRRAMNKKTVKPLVGVVCDYQKISPHMFHVAGDKYLTALVDGADVTPVLIPCIPDMDIKALVSRFDGIFLTGAYSMVDPELYGQLRIESDYDYDNRRDSVSFSTIQVALEKNIPLFGVCRGLQDINVALGGTLHQCIHTTPGFFDHREDKNTPLEKQYSEAHSVKLNQQGKLFDIIAKQEINVNSLHSQAIDELGQRLTNEAVAPDGVIEAVSINDISFGIAVQWHPEWKINQNPIQKKLFEAFGAACRARMTNEKI